MGARRGPGRDPAVAFGNDWRASPESVAHGFPRRPTDPIWPCRPAAETPYPPNRVTPNTRARMMTMVSAVNTARLNQLNQTTGCDG